MSWAVVGFVANEKIAGTGLFLVGLVCVEGIPDRKGPANRRSLGLLFARSIRMQDVPRAHRSDRNASGNVAVRHSS